MQVEVAAHDAVVVGLFVVVADGVLGALLELLETCTVQFFHLGVQPAIFAHIHYLLDKLLEYVVAGFVIAVEEFRVGFDACRLVDSAAFGVAVLVNHQVACSSTYVERCHGQRVLLVVVDAFAVKVEKFLVSFAVFIPDFAIHVHHLRTCSLIVIPRYFVVAYVGALHAWDYFDGSWPV